MDEDLSLCPVRSLRIYLKRTASTMGERQQLFMSVQENREKNFHPNTISAWIKKVIRMTRIEAGAEDCQIIGIKAHQTRGVAVSMALLNNGLHNDIMADYSWKSPATFSNFYLKDLVLIRDKMYHLGPVVATGHVSHVGSAFC